MVVSVIIRDAIELPTTMLRCLFGVSALGYG